MQATTFNNDYKIWIGLGTRALNVVAQDGKKQSEPVSVQLSLVIGILIQ